MPTLPTLPTLPAFPIRLAGRADIPALEALIARSAAALSAGFYTPAQAQALARDVFGVDTQLIDDATYYVMEDGGALLACGGWSRRSTTFGGDKMKRAPERLLDPACEAARIRAFFVDPGAARRGCASALLAHCHAAAAAAGFNQVELVATLPGVPLYLARDFAIVERFELALSQGERAPLVRMRRAVG